MPLFGKVITSVKKELTFFTSQKMKFFIKDLFSKYDQIQRKLRPHLLKKFSTENFIFSTVLKLSVKPNVSCQSKRYRYFMNKI